MMLQPSLSTTDARGGHPCLGCSTSYHTRTTEHRATGTRATRALERRWTVQRKMMEESVSRYGLATFLASVLLGLATRTFGP